MTFRDVTGEISRAQKFSLRRRKRNRRAATQKTPEMWEQFKEAHPHLLRVGAHPHDHSWFIHQKALAEKFLHEAWLRGDYDDLEPDIEYQPPKYPKAIDYSQGTEPVLTREQKRDLARHAIDVMLQTEDMMVQAERKLREKKSPEEQWREWVEDEVDLYQRDLLPG